MGKLNKALLILCLCFSIAASVSAGTIAKYTKTLDPMEGSATAKSFYVGYKNQEILEATMAPGETVYREYIINNTKDGIVTEVDMDLNIEFQSWVSGGYRPIENLEISLEKYDPTKSDTEKWQQVSSSSSLVGTGVICEKMDTAFKAGVSDEIKIRVVIRWPKDPPVQAEDLVELKNNLKLVVNGTQHIN